MGHDGVKMAILGSNWADLGPSWSYLGLGSIWEPCWHMGGIVKSFISKSFLILFAILASWRGWSGRLGGYVGGCWVQSAPKMGPRWTMFGQVGDLGVHLGAKIGQQEFQRRVQRSGG